MSANLPDDVLGDEIAVSLARMMAAANKQARELGVEASQCLITIAQCPDRGKPVWRINYGAKEYIGRRGGDLIIDVDPVDCSIEKVLRGQ